MSIVFKQFFQHFFIFFANKGQGVSAHIFIHKIYKQLSVLLPHNRYYMV